MNDELGALQRARTSLEGMEPGSRSRAESCSASTTSTCTAQQAGQGPGQ